MYYKDGTIYEGEWYDDKRNGQGMLRLSKNNIRAYPGPEFVVANTLAKWKKLEPNPINFGQISINKLLLCIC